MKTGTHIILFEKLIGILMLEIKNVEFKLKYQKRVVGSQKLCFDLINTTIDTTIKFNKNELMGVLIMINAKDKKIFKFAHSTS